MKNYLQSESSPTELLQNLKKCIEIWFHRSDSLSNGQIQEAIKSILTNGLKVHEDVNNSYQKLANDLNWLNAKTAVNDNNSTSISLFSVTDHANFLDFLSLWILEHFENQSLCTSLQLFVADKELLETHYTQDAFLRDEKYSTALFICLSAIELCQSSLLSQIDSSLYALPTNVLTFKPTHQRSSSHPHFSISPKSCTRISATKSLQYKDQISLFNKEDNINESSLFKETFRASVKRYKSQISTNFQLSRKSKSLPNIKQTVVQRPRSKTISQAISIPKKTDVTKILPLNFLEKTCHSEESQRSAPEFNYQQCCSTVSSGCGSTRNKNLFISKGAISKSKTNEHKLKHTLPPRPHSSGSLKSNAHSLSSNNIKIHFDQSYETRKGDSIGDTNNIIDYGTPPAASSLKGLSPINFLSCISENIFSPTYLQNTIHSSSSADLKSGSNFSTSLTTNDVFGSFSGPRDGTKLNKIQKNIFEDLVIQNANSNVINQNSSIRSGTIGESENLASLLQTKLFSRNHTDLERENAHFKISEAIISVIEHIKWTKAEADEIKVEVGLEEYKARSKANDLKLINKVREKSKKTENCEEIIETATSYLDDSREDSSGPSIAESANEGVDYDEVIEIFDTDLTNDQVSYAEWGNDLDGLSAEVVGLSLISKFSDTQLPRVSELKWLVSEEICTKYNVPQELLPIPDTSFSENPDDHIVHPITRGTRDWAPPRQQIIFTDHPPITRKAQMQKQNYRCAGCGMRVAAIYSNRFRYCNYLGKYHCTGCHRNHISAIPAKVLKKWDFTLYPVSVFSYRLLEQIWDYPLFQVSDVAPTLYSRVRSLKVAKFQRTQLKFLKDFVTTCRFADNEEKLFHKIQTYITTDLDQWSMSDFLDTKNGILQNNLKILIDQCEKHIFNCVLCTARGFICEVCRLDQVIYPWQIKIKRCDNCGTCYHKNCYRLLVNNDCMKCQRLAKKANSEKEF